MVDDEETILELANIRLMLNFQGGRGDGFFIPIPIPSPQHYSWGPYGDPHSSPQKHVSSPYGDSSPHGIYTLKTLVAPYKRAGE